MTRQLNHLKGVTSKGKRSVALLRGLGVVRGPRVRVLNDARFLFPRSFPSVYSMVP